MEAENLSCQGSGKLERADVELKKENILLSGFMAGHEVRAPATI